MARKPRNTEAVPSPPTPVDAAWAGVSSAFGSLGRTFICLDKDFRILHASSLLPDLVGEAGAGDWTGRTAEELLGSALFGPSGTMRVALKAGERHEGWRATIAPEGDEGRQVSGTSAPFCPMPGAACDPRVRYIIVLRPADDDPAALAGPEVHPSGLVARSPAMTRIVRLIDDLAQSEATILLTGESGTGKEMVARAVHARSPRRAGPFIAVNCGALPHDLLESELFGHVRGAFTGAIRDRQGRFELAAGGTLFLDEIADLPLSLQVKLLRVLQERTYEAVGDSRTRTSDARIIAATNASLQRAVLEGRFRDDLYYRLRVVPIEIPPLRERREDIEPLARVLLARVGARQGRAVRFSPAAIRVLLDYPWPGNVRELENALEYAVAVCKGQTLHAEDLPVEITHRGPAPASTSAFAAPPAARREHDPEAEELRQLLDAHHWNRGSAARALGISRTTLWRRMREAGLARA